MQAGTKLKLLIVEDNPLDAELAMRELRRSHIDVEWNTVDTEPGFRAALAQPLDAILSDFTMPQFDGLRALAIARQTCPEVPFLFVSGTIGEENAIRALQNGAVDYVLKNNLIRLPAALTRAVREARERVDRRQAENELTAARNRLVAILEATPDLVGTATPDGRLLYCNRAGLEMLGYPEDHDLRGLTISSQHPDWAAKVLNEDGIPYAVQHGTWSGETALLRQDGTILSISQVVIAHRDAEDNIAYLSTIARDISNRKATEARVQRLNRLYAVLSGINNAIVRQRERQALFAEACRIAIEEGAFAAAWIGLCTQDGRDVVPVATAGMATDDAQAFDWLHMETAPHMALVRMALRSLAPALCNDIAVDPVASAWRARALERGYRSVIVFPLIVAGQTIGVLALCAREAGFFDTEELKLLTKLADDITFALDLISKEERLHYLAYYDPLTDLPNRSLFEARYGELLHATSTTQETIAVVVLRVDRLHTIRQSIGRQATEDLLKTVAARLQQAAATMDVLARVSMEEFALAVRVDGNQANFTAALDQLLVAIRGTPLQIAGHQFNIGCRAGIAFHGSDGTDVETLLRNAEAALHKAEEANEAFTCYKPSFNIRVTEQLTLESRLRRALEDDQFLLHYQPKVDLATGQIQGLEALLRWQDPESGLVSPNRFIPILEETGLILDAGKLAMEQAAAQYLRWKAAGIKPPRIAVNVSAVQLRRSDFLGTVDEVVQRFGGTGHGLDLEITESLIMSDIVGSIGKMHALREMNVQVAIDDFGTGYSSLSYIAKLPLHYLKVDRSFIEQMASDPDHMTIVSAIITLAHAIGLEVIAEGVETNDQAKLLRLLRCKQAQGYLFSPPVPADKITPMLTSTTPTPSGGVIGNSEAAVLAALTRPK